MYERKRNEVSDIYPEYYIIKVNAFDQQIRDKFDEWVYFLKNEQIKESFKAKGLRQAADKLDVLKLSEQEARIYENYLNDLSYERSMIESALIEGEAKGIKEGEAKGKIEIARKMLEDKLPLEKISKYSGLSIDEIKKLL